MVVSIVIIGVLSSVATIMAFLALAPVIQDLGTDSAGFWDDAEDERAIVSRDRAFQAIIVLPIFLLGAIFAWSFLSSTRRDFGEI